MKSGALARVSGTKVKREITDTHAEYRTSA